MKSLQRLAVRTLARLAIGCGILKSVASQFALDTTMTELDEFAICLAFQLVDVAPLKVYLEKSIKKKEIVKPFSLYWRSPLQNGVVETGKQRRLWIDLTWEFGNCETNTDDEEDGSTQLRLGCLWKNCDGHGKYVHNGGVTKEDVLHHFNEELSLDVDSSPIGILCQETAKALKEFDGSRSDNDTTLELHYLDDLGTASFKLLSESRGSVNSIEPTILGLILKNVSDKSSTTMAQLADEDAQTEVMDLFKRWKTTCWSVAVMKARAERAAVPPAIDTQALPDTTPSTPQVPETPTPTPPSSASNPIPESASKKPKKATAVQRKVVKNTYAKVGVKKKPTKLKFGSKR